jgi:hypothetical protein
MRLPAKLIGAGFCGVCLSGCITWLDVSKANGDSDGIHYFLPQTFIVMTPNTDGTVTVETKYIPDPDREYVIATRSFMGNYTMDVNRTDEGFLDTVTFSSDTTGVAKQLIQSGSTVRAAEIDAKAAKAKADADAAKAAADKTAGAIATADKTKSDAQLEVNVTQAKLDKLQQLAGAKPSSDMQAQIVVAQVALAEAQARLTAATTAYNTTAANAAAANGAVAKNKLFAPEPVFFRVDMQPRSVALRQTFAQADRATWNTPKVDALPGKLQVLPHELVVRPDKDTGALTGTVKADRALQSARYITGRTQPDRKPLPPKAVIVSLQGDKSTVLIELPQSLPAGDYEIDTQMKPAAPEDADELPESFVIRVERPPK